MRTGKLLGFFVPFPTWTPLLSPQHQTCAPAATAQVCCTPSVLRQVVGRNSLCHKGSWHGTRRTVIVEAGRAASLAAAVDAVQDRLQIGDDLAELTRSEQPRTEGTSSVLAYRR